MSEVNADQAQFWGTEAGDIWVRLGDQMDALLAPVLDEVLRVADLSAGDHVLDIGCGAGASTIAAGQRLDATGTALGADISPPLLARAEQNAKAAGLSHVRFAHCDAQTHAFEAGHFDRVISRFGVMFFEDPVAAFSNLRSACRPGARLAFAAWGAIPANPFFTLAAAVAREHFGDSAPKMDPEAPGPFSFQDPARIRSILEGSDWKDVTVTPTAIPLIAPSAAALATLWADIGPAKRAMTHFGGTAQDRTALTRKMEAALGEFEENGRVILPSEINIATASQPSA